MGGWLVVAGLAVLGEMDALGCLYQVQRGAITRECLRCVTSQPRGGCSGGSDVLACLSRSG